MNSSAVHTVMTMAQIISLATFVGFILLQLFLSKKEKRLLGLILPSITFLHSIISVMNALLNGLYNGATDINAVMRFLFMFILYNFRTVILLIIYFICRFKLKQKKQLNKMNIQDLS